MKLFRSTLVIAFVAMAVLAYFCYDQAHAIQARDTTIGNLNTEIATLHTQIDRYKVTTALLKGAQGGIRGTTPEPVAVTAANKVMDLILTTKNPPELKFAECWDRKLRTTQWGSMGPYGLLDECIDSITEAKTAILMRETDNAMKGARAICSKDAEDHYHQAINCWADGSYRLILSANDMLFDFATTADWLKKQTSAITDK